MQGSQRIKSHQKPNSQDKRRDKGKHKPQAQRQAKSRLKYLKSKYGV